MPDFLNIEFGLNDLLIVGGIIAITRLTVKLSGEGNTGFWFGGAAIGFER